MKLFRLTITPTSAFITPLKGDTLFGMICWATRYEFGEERLIELIKDYAQRPFLVVSDGFLSGFLPKPNLPSIFLGEDKNLKKENRKKIWLSFGDFANGDFTKAKTADETSKILKSNGVQISKTQSEIVSKNVINYSSFIADDPYSQVEFTLPPQDIYFLLDESKFSVDELKSALKYIGETGYGKKSSTGKGRFNLGEFAPIELGFTEVNFMTLSPCALQKTSDLKDCFYEPFTRFGKHGADFATAKFYEKSPILLADTGAVLFYETTREMRFVGRAISGHSRHTNTIHQGYAIILPINFRDKK